MKNSSLFSLFLAVLICSGNAVAQERVISFQLGLFTISTLSEGEQNGKTSVLIDAPQDVLTKYAPEGTYPSAMNAFLIRTPDKTVLVDTGLGRKLFDHLEALGVTPESVDAILITHIHGDHVGGLMKNGQPAFPKAKLYMAKAEHDHWTSESQMNLAPENRRGNFSQARAIVEACQSRIHLFEPAGLDDGGCVLFEGFRAYDARGHTPGHTVYLVESEDSCIMILGDIIHCMSVQMPHPEIAVTYDTDPAQAIATRKKFFDYLSLHRIQMAGMHTPFPGVGYVSPQNGGFSFAPLCLCEGF